METERSYRAALYRRSCQEEGGIKCAYVFKSAYANAPDFPSSPTYFVFENLRLCHHADPQQAKKNIEVAFSAYFWIPLCRKQESNFYKKGSLNPIPTPSFFFISLSAVARKFRKRSLLSFLPFREVKEKQLSGESLFFIKRAGGGIWCSIYGKEEWGTDWNKWRGSPLWWRREEEMRYPLSLRSGVVGWLWRYLDKWGSGDTASASASTSAMRERSLPPRFVLFVQVFIFAGTGFGGAFSSSFSLCFALFLFWPLSRKSGGLLWPQHVFLDHFRHFPHNCSFK